MKNIQVLGDPNNRPFGSSDIIISNLNRAAKTLGIWADDGLRVVYDCIGNQHNQRPDAMIIVYEMIFPSFILSQTYPKPMFGVSRDNLGFMLEAGYPAHLCNYFHLGVDTKIWSYREKKPNRKFTLLGIGESNSRGGLELVVQAFCAEFENEDVRLYLRDRSASDTFKTWVQEQAKKWNVEIIHDDRYLEDFEEEKRVYYEADAAICLNKSSTWNLRTIECMATGTPLIVIPYAGPRDYSDNNLSALHVKFDLMPFRQEDIDSLGAIGLRNHLFHPSMHAKTPYWSSPDLSDVQQRMREVVENHDLRAKVGTLGAVMAGKFTWERSATMLHHLMNTI